MPRSRPSSPPALRRRLTGAGSLVALLAGLIVPLGPVTARAAEAPTTPFSSRMTARWTPYTDPGGVTWAARSTTLGTNRSSTALEGKDIVGTEEDGLYQYAAVGVTGYSVAVPRSGSYRVRLLMAEGWWTAPGKRVFDVAAEGVPAAEGVDVFAAVGKGAAHEVAFTVGVDDGSLDLRFAARADLPIVSAIAVDEVPTPVAPDLTPSDEPTPAPTSTAPVTSSPTSAPTTSAPTRSEPVASAPPAGDPTPTATTTTTSAPEPTVASTPSDTATSPSEEPRVPVLQETFAFRMSTSPVDVVDSRGHTWKRRGPALGSAKFNTRLIGKDIAGTDDDALYQRSVVGPKGMLVPVPAAAADYRVRLLFAEGWFTEPGMRVVDVQAEDRTVAVDVDPVAAVGAGAAYDVVFDTRVEDGMLTIEFVNKVDQPLVAGIEVTSTDPAAATGLSMASLIPHHDDGVFKHDLTAAPAAPNSPEIVTRLRRAIDAGKGWNAGVNAYQYNSAFYRATPDTPRHTVAFFDCQKKGYIPTGLYDGPKYFVDVPIPDGAMPATGTDSQMGVYDPSSDTLWEFWVMRKTSVGWEACWGGRIDDVSRSTGQFPNPYGVSASGLVMAGGMVSVQEAARGEIDHALYLTVTEAQKLLFSYPANRTDGQTDAPDVLQEGQRLRLDPTLDVTTLGLTPFGEVVARAAQKYGFIVADIGGAVAIGTESGYRSQVRTGLNPWNVLLGGPSYDALARFPWDKVEAMPVDHGDPAK